MQTYKRYLDEPFKSFHRFSILILHSIFNNNKSIFRILMTLLSTCLAIWMMTSAFRSLMDNHPITSISTKNHPVSAINFPTISICNNNKVSKREFQAINSILLNHGIKQPEIDDFAKSLQFLISFSTYNYFNKKPENHTKIFEILRQQNYTVDLLMLKVMQPCHLLVKECFFRSDYYDCHKMLKVIKSTEGYCCALNYYGAVDFETVNNSHTIKPKQMYTTDSGLNNGIAVRVNVDPDDYVAPARPIVAAIIVLSDPVDYPESSAKQCILGLGKLTNVILNPSEVQSSPPLQNLGRESRHCFVPADILTSSDKMPYSYHTCIVKCRVQFIYHTCHCVPFFYPTFSAEKRRVCELSDLECLNRNKGKFQGFLMNDNKSAISFNELCDCLPECDDKYYKMQTISQSLISTTHYLRGNLTLDSMIHGSLVNVYFQFHTCTMYLTEPFILWNDFIATIGGTLSLCLGGSILSIVELCYHLVIKRCLPTVRKGSFLEFNH